jgi:hypothetical protein
MLFHLTIYHTFSALFWLSIIAQAGSAALSVGRREPSVMEGKDSWLALDSKYSASVQWSTIRRPGDSYLSYTRLNE